MATGKASVSYGQDSLVVLWKSNWMVTDEPVRMMQAFLDGLYYTFGEDIYIVFLKDGTLGIYVLTAYDQEVLVGILSNFDADGDKGFFPIATYLGEL